MRPTRGATRRPRLPRRPPFLAESAAYLIPVSGLVPRRSPNTIRTHPGLIFIYVSLTLRPFFNFSINHLLNPSPSHDVPSLGPKATSVPMYIYVSIYTSTYMYISIPISMTEIMPTLLSPEASSIYVHPPIRIHVHRPIHWHIDIHTHVHIHVYVSLQNI